jgi:Xaa-Pro aminopeptidase
MAQKPRTATASGKKTTIKAPARKAPAKRAPAKARAAKPARAATSKALRSNAGSKVVVSSSIAPPKVAAPASPVHPPRIARLRSIAAARELSHFLITDPRDVGYLTGFLGGDSYLIVPTDERQKPILVSDFRYQEELAHFEHLVRVVIRKTTMLPCIAETFGGEGISRCGVQGDHMTLGERDALVQLLSKTIGAMADAVLITTRGILLEMRAVKDAHEVNLIRGAVKIQQESLLAVLPTIAPGQSELDIASRLEGEMKRRGSVEPAFVSIIAARANGSLPHYRPAFTKTAANQPLLVDWGAMWDGYRSDMTRTFTLGKWSPKMREIYQIVLEAHILSADALKAGRTTAEIDKIARDHIAKAGYGEFFGHGLGHGIGINIHEEPRLTQQTAPQPLQAGNVVTIEPGIYLPGVGGVRLENDYLVTESGATCLCTLPMSLEWATLSV